MIRRPPRSTRTDTLFPYTTLFRSKTVIDLGDHRCLGYTLSHAVGPSSWSFGSNGDIKVPVSGPLRAGNGDALVAAAIAGMGIVYQPTFIVAEIGRAHV